MSTIKIDFAEYVVLVRYARVGASKVYADVDYIAKQKVPDS